MLIIETQRPLPVTCHTRYQAMAADRERLCLTAPARQVIHVFNSNEQEAVAYPTERRYTCLCYDKGEDCFWAGADGCLNKLFRLDKNFCEVGQLTLPGAPGAVFGVAWCRRGHALAVILGESIFLLSGPEYAQVCLFCRLGHVLPMGLACVGRELVCCYFKGGKEYLALYSQEGDITAELALPKDLLVQGLLPIAPGPAGLRLRLLATMSTGTVALLDVTWKNVGNRCIVPPCPPPCPPPPCPTDVATISHTARVQYLVSHILNTAGQKLLDALEMADSVEEILCVSRSINRMLVYITHLEHTLYANLEAKVSDRGAHS